jgi:hypothetical protein
MYKVLIAFNEFVEGQEIRLKPNIAASLINDKYVIEIEEKEIEFTTKRGRKPKE